jgi:hypothetical protein
MDLPCDNETLFSPFNGRSTPLSFLGYVTRDRVADVNPVEKGGSCLALPCLAFSKAWQGKAEQDKSLGTGEGEEHSF